MGTRFSNRNGFVTNRPFRERARAVVGVSRDHHDVDVRPPLAHLSPQGVPVDRARDVSIGDERGQVGATAKEGESCVGIGGLTHVEAGLRQVSGDRLALVGLLLHDEHHHRNL